MQQSFAAKLRSGRCGADSFVFAGTAAAKEMTGHNFARAYSVAGLAILARIDGRTSAASLVPSISSWFDLAPGPGNGDSL